MFFEDKRKLKVNLGDKNISSKDEFLKKIKQEKQKEESKSKIKEAENVIANFLKKIKFESERKQNPDALISNLKSVVALLDKGYDQNMKDKIICNCFRKVRKEIEGVLCIGAIRIYQMEVINICLKLLKSLLEPPPQEMFSLLRRLISFALVDFYRLLMCDKLKDDHPFYRLIEYTHLHSSTMRSVFSVLSKNSSTLFLLNRIGRNLHKVLIGQMQSEIIVFMLELSYSISIRRKSKFETLSMQTSQINFDKFSENAVMLYFNYFTKQSSSESTTKVYSICTSLTTQAYLNKVPISRLVQLLSDVSALLQTNDDMRRSFLRIVSLKDLTFFEEVITSLGQAQKLKLDRKEMLKNLNIIFEFIIESTNQLLNNKEYILKLIRFIYKGGKLIENLYHSDFEKTNFYSILDFILNKISNKFNPRLNDEILLFSVDLLQKGKDTLTSNTNIDDLVEIFEVISFVILSKIEYKDNYFFIEFQSTHDIYKNLPFNYIFLNVCSKYLLQIFTILISKTCFEELSNLQDNVIIKCLKALYMLDNEIEFTTNRNTFWTNLELAGKLSNDKHQIEKMKLMPFAFPFMQRLNALNLEAEKMRRQVNNNYHNSYHHEYSSRREIELKVPRENMFDTTLTLYLNGKLHPFQKWRITFIDKFGNMEEGIDAGGLYKEFLYKLSEQAFSTSTQLFTETNTGFLIPNVNSAKVTEIHLSIFEFLGFLTGRAIIKDVKIYPNFSVIFLNNILEVENSFAELKSYDYELYKNLLQLKNYTGDVENDFGLNFTITDEKIKGNMSVIELIENGRNINVNSQNKLLYIKKVAEYKLTYQFKEQCDAYKKGLFTVVDEDLIKTFTGDELRQLIYGFDKNALDVVDLKMNTSYEGWDWAKEEQSCAVNAFWEILDEFEDKEKEKFLFFVTSLKRAPIGGFKKLSPRFIIARSQQNVPTSSTCVNMLKLPVIPKEKMREIMKYVINADAGFYFA